MWRTPTAETIKYLKDNYLGKTIKIISMSGESKYDSKTGVVKFVDDMGQLHGTWGGLSLIPGEDSFEVIE
jgi:acetylornithine/succinyldiaminopimelate/putrescine aminotransferase